MASLPDSHSNTSKGEIFLSATTSFDVEVELLRMCVVEASEGPLMLRETIWCEDANAPTAHEKSPEIPGGTIEFSLGLPDNDMRTISRNEILETSYLINTSIEHWEKVKNR